MVSRNWEFRASEPSGISRIPRVHCVPGMARLHLDLFFLFLSVDFCDDVRIGWYVQIKDTEVPKINESQRVEITNWLRIGVGIHDPKILLKLTQLYASFVSIGLISQTPCLFFIKFEDAPLEKRFSLPPPPPVVDRLKRKHEQPLLKSISSEGKSQNIDSSMRGSVKSPMIHGKTCLGEENLKTEERKKRVSLLLYTMNTTGDVTLFLFPGCNIQRTTSSI